MNARSRPRAPTAPLLQFELFGDPIKGPPGFRYGRDFIDTSEEAALIARLEALPFEPFDFHGHLANRRVAGFGLRYDYERRVVTEAPPLPDWLMDLRRKVGAFADRAADAFVQVLINEYRQGAGIGWHKDRPQFDEVVGVSLMAPCTLRFRRKTGDGWERISSNLEVRSAYLLTGPSRSEWEHSISPLDQRRYSITFRTLSGLVGLGAS